MSNLHPKQFKNYIPAAQAGRAASDWLATDEGHHWQDNNFYHDAPHEGGNMTSDHPAWYENSVRANVTLEAMSAGIYRPTTVTDHRTGL